MLGRTWIALAAAALLAFPGGAAYASPVGGLWLVAEKDAHVWIGEFHGTYCGRIVWVRDSLDSKGFLRRDTNNPDPSLRGRVMRDLVMVTALAPTSADSTRWKARVYDPRNGHTYNANLTLESSGRLKLRGYIGFSLLGRTAHWTRLPEAALATPNPAEDTKPGPAPALHTKP
jgi:uncharacterized protein (DUF2147 family)